MAPTPRVCSTLLKPGFSGVSAESLRWLIRIFPPRSCRTSNISVQFTCPPYMHTSELFSTRPQSLILHFCSSGSGQGSEVNLQADFWGSLCGSFLFSTCPAGLRCSNISELWSLLPPVNKTCVLCWSSTSLLSVCSFSPCQRKPWWTWTSSQVLLSCQELPLCAVLSNSC